MLAPVGADADAGAHHGLQFSRGQHLARLLLQKRDMWHQDLATSGRLEALQTRDQRAHCLREGRVLRQVRRGGSGTTPELLQDLGRKSATTPRGYEPFLEEALVSVNGICGAEDRRWQSESLQQRKRVGVVVGPPVIECDQQGARWQLTSARARGFHILQGHYCVVALDPFEQLLEYGCLRCRAGRHPPNGDPIRDPMQRQHRQRHAIAAPMPRPQQAPTGRENAERSDES